MTKQNLVALQIELRGSQAARTRKRVYRRIKNRVDSAIESGVSTVVFRQLSSPVRTRILTQFLSRSDGCRYIPRKQKS